MASADSTCYTVIPSPQDLRSALEKGSDDVKIETLRKIIISTINGNPLPTLMMPVMQFVMPSRNKHLKKLLHFYWEVCPKYDETGKLKQEMILVVNAVRNDLQHPNEYIRGATLRFLQKLAKDTDLIEPLIPTVRSCLEHRHSYVRKNAVFALYAIHREAEHFDAVCKRNAFVFLAHASMERAVAWIAGNVEGVVGGMDESMQMAVVDVVRADSKVDSTHKARYIRLIFELLNAPSHAVKYEAATTLTTLTQNPAAVKVSAASCLIQLVLKESDNNVKLIVLDRVDALREKQDIADIEVRRKAMSIEVVLFLKKQLQKTQETEIPQLLIQSIHVTAIKFSEVAASVVHALMDFLGDTNNPSALDVVAFVREVTEKFPNLRASITPKLTERSHHPIRQSVPRGPLDSRRIRRHPEESATFPEIRKVIGEIPILAAEQRLLDEAGGDNDEEKEGERRGGEEGGAFMNSAGAARLEAVKSAAKPPLRTLILAGDFFTGSVLAASLTKLVLRFEEKAEDKAMLIMTSIIRTERIMNCIQTLRSWILFKRAAEKKEAESTKPKAVQVDDLLTFRQFSKKTADDAIDYDEDVGRATGAGEVTEDFMSNLSRITQLTGFSDPIYAEAYVKMHGFDILLDVLLVNQTSNTLQNLCLDFATLGDLKIVERPSVYTIGPHGFQSIKATIKVSSTETGVIFGSILWEGPNMSEACVILNDIHVDIMDYIKPAYCNEAQFRSMWTEFEWENRVNVSRADGFFRDPKDYLQHVMKTTNMACLTPEGATSGDCDFLSANLYARSLFGEDALANLSIERSENGTITGHVRIRSKTQGIALSLGDRITMCMPLSFR
ncbi:coatomer beta subunit appendage platform-domain-containing protein [Cyathus striatus]|nr:coatomer beta subunit appendage platform-domain-containing protein [Cyathus striatus]